MAAPQYAILRFAKYKGPEISGIEAHNERTKEKYASNPDIDPSRTHLNFHLIKPEKNTEQNPKNRSQKQAAVHVLTAFVWWKLSLPLRRSFLRGRKEPKSKSSSMKHWSSLSRIKLPKPSYPLCVHSICKQMRTRNRLHFAEMRCTLCFVPLTEDKRLCAKEILGNKKKLTQWQDKYWEHMVKKYPDLERGESASETGRDHIPTRVFKQMARLNKQHDKLAELLSDMKFTNYKERSAQIAAFLEKYIPDVAAMETQMKKYEKFFKTADGKQKALEKKNADLSAALEESEKESTVKKLQEMRLHSDYERIKGILERIPPEIIKAYTHRSTQKHDIHR